ncbi:hypothetical protein MPH_09834 [Macrophomina phaseolina MS6]|uniref:Uncharacterized protein n=1 Tax=Macrophomina phaseolina (strain MS6) TaxID=1126212 RepID=K2RS25_MACPH|nr:hypothetical protein MPH_09834 [Macrophomina phaseolina MS6]
MTSLPPIPEIVDEAFNDEAEEAYGNAPHPRLRSVLGQVFWKRGEPSHTGQGSTVSSVTSKPNRVSRFTEIFDLWADERGTAIPQSSRPARVSRFEKEFDLIPIRVSRFKEEFGEEPVGRAARSRSNWTSPFKRQRRSAAGQAAEEPEGLKLGRIPHFDEIFAFGVEEGAADSSTNLELNLPSRFNGHSGSFSRFKGLFRDAILEPECVTQPTRTDPGTGKTTEPNWAQSDPSHNAIGPKTKNATEVTKVDPLMVGCSEPNLPQTSTKVHQVIDEPIESSLLQSGQVYEDMIKKKTATEVTKALSATSEPTEGTLLQNIPSHNTSRGTTSMLSRGKPTRAKLCKGWRGTEYKKPKCEPLPTTWLDQAAQQDAQVRPLPKTNPDEAAHKDRREG